MAKYGTTVNATPVTGKTSIMVIGSATVRPKIFEFGISNNATPADGVQRFSLFTSDGTTAQEGGTSLTPGKLDLTDSAAVATSVHTVNTESTTQVDILDVGVNQRATYRWVAAPGSEVSGLLAANAGVGLSFTGTAVANTNTYIWWSE